MQAQKPHGIFLGNVLAVQAAGWYLFGCKQTRAWATPESFYPNAKMCRTALHIYTIICKHTDTMISPDPPNVLSRPGG